MTVLELVKMMNHRYDNEYRKEALPSGEKGTWPLSEWVDYKRVFDGAEKHLMADDGAVWTPLPVRGLQPEYIREEGKNVWMND